jgi:hypothetical protein
LLSIRPHNACGVIHRNPATNGPYVDIRKQWGDFFTFRHTGATHMAERNGADLMKVVNMMGDTNVETVRRHYFNFDEAAMMTMVEGWTLPPAIDLSKLARTPAPSPLIN